MKNPLIKIIVLLTSIVFLAGCSTSTEKEVGFNEAGSEYSQALQMEMLQVLLDSKNAFLDKQLSETLITTDLETGAKTTITALYDAKYPFEQVLVNEDTGEIIKTQITQQMSIIYLETLLDVKVDNTTPVRFLKEENDNTVLYKFQIKDDSIGEIVSWIIVVSNGKIIECEYKTSLLTAKYILRYELTAEEMNYWK